MGEIEMQNDKILIKKISVWTFMCLSWKFYKCI